MLEFSCMVLPAPSPYCIMSVQKNRTNTCLTASFPRTNWVIRHKKGKTIPDFNEAREMGFDMVVHH